MGGESTGKNGDTETSNNKNKRKCVCDNYSCALKQPQAKKRTQAKKRNQAKSPIHAGGCAVPFVVPQQGCEPGVVGVIEHHPVLAFSRHLVEWVVAVEGETRPSSGSRPSATLTHVVGCWLCRRTRIAIPVPGSMLPVWHTGTRVPACIYATGSMLLHDCMPYRYRYGHT